MPPKRKLQEPPSRSVKKAKGAPLDMLFGGQEEDSRSEKTSASALVTTNNIGSCSSQLQDVLQEESNEGYTGRVSTLQKTFATAPVLSAAFDENVGLVVPPNEIYHEKHSGMRIWKLKYTPDEVQRMFSSPRVYKLNSLQVSRPQPGEMFAVIGAVVSRLFRQSAKGATYTLLKITDLQNSSGLQYGLFVFGDAHKHHWKDVQIGAVVGALNPEIKDEKPFNGQKSISFCVTAPDSLVNIGESVDLGYCTALTLKGVKCPNVINKRATNVCAYHAHGAYKKASSKRMDIQASAYVTSSPASARSGGATACFGDSEGKHGPLKLTEFKHDTVLSKFVAKKTTQSEDAANLNCAPSLASRFNKTKLIAALPTGSKKNAVVFGSRNKCDADAVNELNNGFAGKTPTQQALLMLSRAAPTANRKSNTLRMVADRT